MSGLSQDDRAQGSRGAYITGRFMHGMEPHAEISGRAGDESEVSEWGSGTKRGEKRQRIWNASGG